MHTELDTFKRLQQTPFRQLLDSLGTKLLSNEEDISAILKENHWEYDDYRKRLTKYFLLDQNFNIQL